MGLGSDDVRKTKRGGQRGYKGLSIKRAPRRQPSFEFAGRQMLERIANFMRINPPPLPPIKVILFFFGIIQSPYTLIQTCLIEIMIIGEQLKKDAASSQGIRGFTCFVGMQLLPV